VGNFPQRHLVVAFAEALDEVAVGREARGLQRTVAELALLLDDEG